MKYIEFSDNLDRKWALPLEVVAKNRADYYANTDPDTSYEDEINYVMNDNYEGIDWLQNSMGDDEFKDYLILLKDVYIPDFPETIENPRIKERDI